jgi:Glycosyltransferase sugar-binding region containing DXD motif
MIPKKIHYVWVGTQEKSDLILKCIDSWKKHLPDYEVVEWDNVKFLSIKNNYSEQAFQNKKWAFVSDYVRLYALYHEGGIYLDTDVEITNNIDQFLSHDFFTGYENYQGACSPITAVMGATKGNVIINNLLNYYLTANFETAKGLNMQTNTSRITNYFERKFGLKKPYDGKSTWLLDDNSAIYPDSHFCTPVDGSENFAIHHFNGSWLDGYSRRNKCNLFGKYIIARFRKNSKVNSDILPLYDQEKLLSSFKLSDTVTYGLIAKLSTKINKPRKYHSPKH